MDAFLSECAEFAKACRERFGPHPSAEFAVCRITEEVGELAQAATAMSKDRWVDRGPRIREEARDSIAMILRLLEEFPEGKPEPPEEPCATCGGKRRVLTASYRNKDTGPEGVNVFAPCPACATEEADRG